MRNTEKDALGSDLSLLLYVTLMGGIIGYCDDMSRQHTINLLVVSGKRDVFVHIFKIELLAPQGRVSPQL